jgi:hypothetical protein
MRSLILLSLFFLFGALPPAAALGLAWDTDRITINADPDQKEAKAEFSFHNTGDRSITIKSVTTSCGCTTAALGKKAYAAGEGGKIEVVFTIGDRTGPQEKSILVQTDDPRETEPIELSLRINIRDYLDFAPHLLIWKVGDATTEKTITCTALLPAAVVLTEAHSTNPAFTTRIETVEPGRKYLVHLKPVSTVAQSNATIPMSFTATGAQGARSLSFDAFACVSN